MASPTVTYTFSNSTVADAAEVNTNFSDLINALTDGTSDHSISTLTLASTFTANGNVTLGNASGDTLTVNATPTFAAATTFSSTIDVTGTASFDGDVNIGDGSGDTITVAGTSTFTAAATFSSTLDVTGTASFDGAVNLGDASGDAIAINGTTTVNAPFTIGAHDFSVDSNLLFVDESADRVGLGTGGPGNRVDILAGSGDGTTDATMRIRHPSNNSGQHYIQFRSSSNDTGGVERNGSGTSPQFFSGSDRRIKKNIEPLEPMLEKIIRVDLKRYDLKSGGHDIGPIAQQLVEVFPNKVTKTDDGLGKDLPVGVRAWTIGRDFTFEMMKAIQEQQAMIEELKARISKLDGGEDLMRGRSGC